MNSEINIIELIHKGGVFHNVKGSTAEEVYRNITNAISMPKGLDKDVLYEELCNREQLMTTAVGNGIALPHPRYPLLKKEDDQKIVVCFLEKPLIMSAPDSKPVYVMMLLLTNNSQAHLKILSQLAFLFQKSEVRNCLESSPVEAELLTTIKQFI